MLFDLFPLLSLVQISVATVGDWESLNVSAVYQFEGVAAVSVNADIYVIGGMNNGNYNSHFYKTDEHFSPEQDLGFPTNFSGAAYCTLTNVNTGLLLAGGIYQGSALSNLYFYSFGTPGWDNTPRAFPNSITLYKHSAASHITGEYMLIYGGMNNASIESTVVYICKNCFHCFFFVFLSHFFSYDVATNFQPEVLNITNPVDYPPSISPQLSFWFVSSILCFSFYQLDIKEIQFHSCYVHPLWW